MGAVISTKDCSLWKVTREVEVQGRAGLSFPLGLTSPHCMRHVYFYKSTKTAPPLRPRGATPWKQCQYGVCSVARNWVTRLRTRAIGLCAVGGSFAFKYPPPRGFHCFTIILQYKGLNIFIYLRTCWKIETCMPAECLQGIPIVISTHRLSLLLLLTVKNAFSFNHYA